MKPISLLYLLLPFLLLQRTASLTSIETTSERTALPPAPKVYYGIASYYADKFNGRPTANGEIYDQQKFTAACNVLPLGTWIRVTNLNNNKTVIVKTNDRLHPRMKRIVDLSKIAAKKLGYTGRGLTQVKVEVIDKKTAVSE
ncbi:MAG TPA: septal ring lytic transglycosylase RlpA family protein [Flavisolibacter sp.]|jgi:rare lipoprotein A|nr:septal ring lytic transglycosylase RlpA family protein [Flavisolibacter sp.]